LPDEAEHLQFKEGRADFGRGGVFPGFDEGVEVSSGVRPELPEHPAGCNSLRAGFAWFRCGGGGGRFRATCKVLILKALSSSAMTTRFRYH
jgi:hypothetical protein